MGTSISLLTIFEFILYIVLLVFSIAFAVKQWITMNRIREILEEIRTIKISVADTKEENKRMRERMTKLHELLSNYLSEKSKEASQETK